MIDYSAIQQVIDDTNCNTRSKQGLAVSTESVKAQIISENKVKIVYLTVVNFVKGQDSLQLKEHFVKVADARIESFVKMMIKNYKSIVAEGTIKADRIVEDYSIETINFNSMNGERTAYLRRISVFEIKE